LIKGRSIISLGALELHSQSEPFVQIEGSCAKSLAAINTQGAKISQKDPDSIASKRAWVRDLKHQYPFNWPLLPAASSSGITTDQLLTLLEEINYDINLVTDVGGARIYSGLYWWPTQAQSFFSPYASGAMGWSLGAGAGVYLAKPEKPTVVLIGDGSLWMFGNELATLFKYRIPLLVILVNNFGYGSVAKRYDGEDVTNLAQTPEIDWCAYADSMGCEVQRIESLDHFKKSAAAYFENFLKEVNPGPLLLEIITPSENLFPSGALTTNGYQEDPFQNGY
jgi:acetolactate synthase-1/2/3 large subunit